MPSAYYSRVTDETVRESSEQVRWSSQLLQRQLVLYSHTLRVEKSDPLQMDTFGDNLNIMCPPGSSKKRGRARSFWVQKVGAIARDRVLRLPRGVRQRSVQEVAQDRNLWRKIGITNQTKLHPTFATDCDCMLSVMYGPMCHTRHKGN